MRNDRGTLQIKTGNLPIVPVTPYQFLLDPFTVHVTPNAYEHYTRYTLLANGVPIRDQISYPEEDDGWQGLSFCRANHSLTEAETEALKEFHHQQRHVQRRVK